MAAGETPNCKGNLWLTSWEYPLVVVVLETGKCRFHETVVHVFNGRGGNQKV
jgi:hypothetical protein